MDGHTKSAPMAAVKSKKTWNYFSHKYTTSVVEGISWLYQTETEVEQLTKNRKSGKAVRSLTIRRQNLAIAPLSLLVSL
ncbi:MAG: hypothetical protein ACM3MG_05050 [Bacillota bacterium]